MSPTVEEYDYVVVGGGTAGSVLASRLSEQRDVRVLVLEAGHGFVPADVDSASVWFHLLGSAVDWGYHTVPQPGLDNRATYEPRGCMPGGSSNLYIMMHVRGHPSDFDNWAYQGAAGWSYADIAPYFAKLESQEDRTDPRIGTTGPQTVTNAGLHDPNPLSQAFLDACGELGYPSTPDFNGPQMLGAGWHHIDVKDGRRQGALISYLEPALGRPNLTLRTSAMATGLRWKDNRCTGVTYRRRSGGPATSGPGRRLVAASPTGAGEHIAMATREVIVAGGAIESPKFLMLSGVGPAEQLRGHGIDVIADLPGVGENFHNHVLVGIIAETSEPTRPGTQNLSEAALFVNSQAGMLAPDIQIGFVHVPFDIIVGQQYPNAVSLLPGIVRPVSRGWIRLASADPMCAPLINPNYLGDSSDLERLVDAVDISRDLFASPALAKHLVGEIVPGSGVVTRDELRAFVRDRADSYHHQAGSCRMGIDDLAVVDPQLRVRGTEGLRVVDASVMPAVPSGNCHTAIVAIAERAADLIKGTQPS